MLGVAYRDLGEDQPFIIAPPSLLLALDLERQAGLGSAVLEARHRPADNLAVDQLDTFLVALQQVIDSLESLCFH